jgi:putative hydrolase of the HAD superfamily
MRDVLTCAMPYTHVLFDFFGTLVSYSASHIAQGHARTHSVLAQAGSSLPYDRFLGVWDAHFEAFDRRADSSLTEYSMDELCSSFLRELVPVAPHERLVHRFRDAYLDEWNEGVLHLPEVNQLLCELAQRFTLALVTNTHHAELVRGHLRRMEVERYFAAVVTSVEHGRRKPSPCIFAHALHLCGGTASSALYIGDSYTADYQGACAAGLHCLLIDPEGRHDVPAAHRLNHITDLRTRLLRD